jgi:hypothetical protein
VIGCACGSASEIPSSDRLWRRFKNSKNHLVWDYDKKGWIPSPEALQFDVDGMSTSWREHLVWHGLGPEAVLVDGYTLVGQWAVGFVRDEHKFLVEHSPTDSEPVGCAHTSVRWPAESIGAGKTEPEKGLRRRLRTTLAGGLSWTYGTITIERQDS